MPDNLCSYNQYQAENDFSDEVGLYDRLQSYPGVSDFTLGLQAEVVQDAENAMIEATHHYTEYLADSGEIHQNAEEGTTAQTASSQSWWGFW